MSKIRLIPTLRKGNLEDVLINVLKTATHRFWCSSPFVTANGLNIIKQYLKEGVDYRLITRLNEEDVMNGMVDLQAIASFVEAGGKARYHDRSLHAKVWIADDSVFVGSANLTGSGLNDNIELIAAISENDTIRVSPFRWFSRLWTQLKGSEKSPADLRALADSLAVSTAAERIKSIGRMKELKDFGIASSLTSSGMKTGKIVSTGWFKINGVSNEDRIKPDFDLRDLLIYEGGQTVSRKGRPRWRAGEKVILSYLAERDDGFNDYCVYGRGIVDVAHRPGTDEMPEWLRVGESITRKDYAYISRWPYIVWLRDVQIVNGQARSALWLSNINEHYGEPVVSPGSLTRKSYIRLGAEQLAAFDDLFDHLFLSGPRPLYLANPEQVWWNSLINDQGHYITKARVDADVNVH
ncbi:phospholipase D family protein [Chloroflexota bacterium]